MTVYEELIAALNAADKRPCSDLECPGSGECPTVGCLFREAADAIEELQKDLERSKEYEAFWEKEANEALKKFQVAIASKPRWIPVTERLPDCEKGSEVGNVEWVSYGMVFAGCFGRGGKWRDAYFRTWTDATEGIDAKDVECWRIVSLPDPPKEDA